MSALVWLLWIVRALCVVGVKLCVVDLWTPNRLSSSAILRSCPLRRLLRSSENIDSITPPNYKCVCIEPGDDYVLTAKKKEHIVTVARNCNRLP